MSLIRARALGALAFGGVAAARAAGAGFGGGGGGGRPAGAFAAAAGPALDATFPAGAGAAFASGRGTGQPDTFGGGAAALGVKGVPQRAQNLKLAAFNVMQLGHCLGGPPACCSLGAGPFVEGFIMVGAPASSGCKATPHERHEPTSVSLWAPHLGQSMWPVVVRAAKEGQGRDLPREGAFLHWK
jgi:hypothetical protein